MYYGSWKINDTLVFVCNTHNPTNGMATNADAVPSYHVYEDETATPIITGTMSLLNNPNTIGFYSEQITLSAANGLEKGKSYNIYIRAVVANVTGTMAHSFQMEAEVDANTVSVPVTAGMVTGSVLGNVDGSVASVSGNVGGNVVGSVGSVLGSVGSVTNPVTAGNVTGSVFGNVNGSVGSVAGNVGGNVVGSVGSVVSPVGINTGTFLNALADTVWDEALSGHLVDGSAGHTLFSRMPTGAVLVGDKTGFSLSSPQAFNLIGNISGTLSNVNNVVNPVTVGTNNDKTGYSLASPQSVDIIGNISGTITNVLNVVNPVVAGVVTGSVLGNVNGSVDSVVQPVGISTGSFISAIADGVWDEQLSGHQAAGSAGLALSSASSAGDPWATSLPGSYTAGQAGHILASRMPTGTVLVGDKTGFSLSTPQAFDLIGNISGTLSNVVNVVNPVVAGVVTGSVLGNVNGSVNNVVQSVGISTGSFINAIADQVWDEQLSGHLTAGSAGSSLNGAGSAGDPWTTALPGAYGAGTAGHILASRMPTGTVIVGANNDKTGYSLSSTQNINISGTFVGNIQGNVTGSVGEVLTIGAALANKIADHVLRRTYANARASSDGDAVSFRSLLGAIAKLVNKWSISGSTLTVTHEDDSTTAGTQALTSDAAAEPITSIDTN